MRKQLTFAQKLHKQYGNTLELRQVCCDHFILYVVTEQGECFKFEDNSYLVIQKVTVAEKLQ